jgi:surface-anchored protein
MHDSMPRRRLALCLLTFLLPSLFAAKNAAANVFASGHGDIGGVFDGQSLTLEIHLENAGVELAPDEAIVVVPATTRELRPLGTSFDALGVHEGGFIYKLSQNSFEATVLDDAPFLGLATEEIPPFTFQPFPGTDPAQGVGRVRLELLNVVGPGHFGLWRVFPGGPGWESRDGFVGLPLASADGIDPIVDYVDLPTGIHEHANWAFTAAGDYQVTFRLSGELVGGEAVAGVGTYHFQVVPEPNAVLIVVVAAICCGVLSRRAVPIVSR